MVHKVELVLDVSCYNEMLLLPALFTCFVAEHHVKVVTGYGLRLCCFGSLNSVLILCAHLSHSMSACKDLHRSTQVLLCFLWKAKQAQSHSLLSDFVLVLACRDAFAGNQMSVRDALIRRDVDNRV